MGFFDKRKSRNGSLSTLSEEEIQEKLYGYRQSSTLPGMSDEDIIRDNQVEDSYSEGRFKDHPEQEMAEEGSTVVETDDEVEPQSSYTQDEQDLFNMPGVDVKPKDDFSSDESEFMETPQDDEFEEEEDSFFDDDKVVEEPLFKVRTIKAPEPKPLTDKVKGFFVGFVGALSVGVKAVIVAVGKAVAFLLKVLYFVLNCFDPRKPHARKILYVAAACFLIVSLFWGVHQLNEQRNAAMLTDPTSSRGADQSSAVSSAETQKGQSLSVSSTEVVDTSSDEVVSGQRETRFIPVSEVSEKEVVPSTDNVESVQEISVVSQGQASTALGGASSEGRYVIQIATYAGERDAGRITDALNEDGVRSFFKGQVRRSSGKMYFSVFVGRFANFKEAQAALADFRKLEVARPFNDAFIRTLD